MYNFGKLAVAGIVTVASLLTPLSMAGAQTPTEVWKDMFGNDCVTELQVKEALSPNYAVVVFMNTCNRSFSIEWTVNGQFRGNTGIAALGNSEATVLRADLPKMAWRFY